jgi:hypothetical protein
MTAPLPPAVNGPIYAVPHVHVAVDNVLPDALVKVFQNGSEVGHATSSIPGLIWVPTTVALVAGHKITATQTYTGSASYISATPGVSSAASPFPVTVLAVPKLLPVPVFLSAVSVCSSAVWLGNLIPDATVTITQGGTTLAHDTAEYPQQWFNLTGPKPAPNQPIEARQAFGNDTSQPGFSALVMPVPSSPLPTPVAATPLFDCQSSMDCSSLSPGATVEVVNGGVTQTGIAPAESATDYLHPSLKAGPLTIQQYFPRCQQVPHSPVAHYEVSGGVLPRPQIGYALCADLSQLTVTNLVPGEILTVTAVTAGGALKDLGPQGVHSTSVTVYLPPLPAGTVALRISVTLCGLSNLAPPSYVTVPVSTSTAPIGPPNLQGPLYACAGEVVVTGAHPGSLLTVFSGTVSNVLANPVVATADVVVIQLQAVLVAGEQVAVQQTGCRADGPSKPLTVKPTPSPIPVPVITQPVLSDATAVTVSGVLPGAQVFLYVDGVFRNWVTALGTSASVPTGTEGLTTAHHVQVTQEICGQVSALLGSGPGYAGVQAPAPKPSGGLQGNSGYFFQNSCANLLGVTVTIDVTEEIGGPIPAYTGFGFQLNCWSQGVTDVNAWQQFAIIIDPSGTSSPSILALVNSWPYNWNGTVTDDTIDQGQNLASLATASLPAGYQFSIQLANEASGKITSATFGGADNNGNAFTPQTITLTGLADQQGGTITDAQLSPIVAFQLLLVGPSNSANTKLTTGAGTMTISANSNFIATNTLPSGCDFFTGTGTAENANSTYGELPATPNQTFVQTFGVS